MVFSSSRALTRAHTLMKLPSPRVATPSSVHSLSSRIPTNGSHSEVDFHSKQCANGEACSLVNRFLKEGSSIPHKVMKHEKALYVRLDMPGIRQEGLKLWVEGNFLHVNGEEQVEKGYWGKHYPRRKYYGKIEIPQDCYKVEERKMEFKHDVLKIKIPKRVHIANVKVKCPCPDETPKKKPGDDPFLDNYDVLLVSFMFLFLLNLPSR